MTTQSLERLAAALADRYRIERELGAGGMATVYLANDLRHSRKVAIKVLRPELAAVIGAERFLAEIKTTANLQHPHILPLHDSGEADSFLYYVMPYVEGESLRDRLNREHQLPIGDAVRIAGEVAGALDYAHRHSIVHRDIKPENILLHDGRALVADFGIALAASSASTRMTETGMSLGTPTYMSPEQAMGERTLDARSDIYALGCVLYEMLVGDPPFLGSTAQAIVARVMTEKPAPPSRIRDTVPPHVEDATLTALEKLPADRFATAGEFAAALTGAAGTASVRRTALRPAPDRPWHLISAGLGLLVLALAALSTWALSHGPSAEGPAVFDAALPDSAAMTFAATTASTAYGVPLRNLSVARSGDFVVYAASLGDSTALWYRNLHDGTARLIPGTAGGTVPRVSPDGSQVAFLIGGRVMVVPVGGGGAKQLREGRSPLSLEWISPTALLFNDLDGNRLTWLDPATPPRAITVPRCTFGAWAQEVRLLVCAVSGTASILDPETGQRWQIRTLRPDGTGGGPIAGSAFRLVEGRYLIYLSPDGDLRAVPYDGERHSAGRSVTLISGIRREAVGEGQFDLTADGALVYAPGADATVGPIVRLSAGSAPEPLSVDPAAFQRYDLSRDRRWLAVVVQTAEGHELRIHDLRLGQRLTWLRGEYIRHPLWHPDSERLMVGVREGERWALLAGVPGSGSPPDTLAAADTGGVSFDPIDYSADTLAIVQTGDHAGWFDPSAAPARLDTVATGALFTTLSPDGRYLLFGEESGRILVTRFPGGGRRWQLASDGVEPLWLSPSEVVYRSGVSWYLARIDARTGEPIGAPTFWARDPRFSDTSGWSNRPSHDGGIIYLQGPSQVKSTYLRVIPGWAGRMKQAVDAANR